MSIYASNVGEANYVNQLITKVKRYIDKNTLIVGDFNMLLSASDRYPNQNITKETRPLNDTLDQIDFTEIYRIFHPNTTEFLSSAHGTFSRRHHILGHKSGLNRYQKIGIVPCIFSDHKALKLELNHKKKFGRIWLKTILQKMKGSTRKLEKN